MQVQIEAKEKVSEQVSLLTNALAVSVTESVTALTNQLKQAWRNEILAAGLGRKVANSIRAEVYPKNRVSANAAGLVYTRTPRIIVPFERGATIMPAKKQALSIPLPIAGRGPRGQHIGATEWTRLKGIPLEYASRSLKRPLLFARGVLTKRGFKAPSKRTRRKVQRVPVYFLIRSVRIRKRLRLLEIARSLFRAFNLAAKIKLEPNR